MVPQPTTDIDPTVSDTAAELRDAAGGDRASSAFQAAPTMSTRGLSALLLLMCLVPPITIFTLWKFLPPVFEGKLDAAVTASGLPPDSFYEPHYSERPKFSGGVLLLTNREDQDWTHLNIQINRHYQIYDTQPIAAGQQREFDLSRFVSRTGARFDLTYNPLRHVRVYARRPTRDRATFEYSFESPSRPN